MNKVLIVGAGLTGAVIARKLADEGYKITIWERRNHIAGNMYDFVDEYGVTLHKYGPHIFHTNENKLYEFMKQYGEWEDYYLTCGVEIDGTLTPSPFNLKTVDTYFEKAEAKRIKSALQEVYPNRKTITVVEALNSNNLYIRKYAEFLFEKDYKPYTAKQWGIAPEEIDTSVLNRVPLRLDYCEGYFDDKYQIVPQKSYVDFFDNLLNHENITVELNVDALERLKIMDHDVYVDGLLWKEPVVYTGALDELFDNKYGFLPYRSVSFEWKHEDIDSKQNYTLVAYPMAEGYTRIVEYKKFQTKKTIGTTYGLEYPVKYEYGNGTEPYYPVLTSESKKLYSKYIYLTKKTSNLYPCGRLGDFTYYNMDSALSRALDVAQKIIGSKQS